MAASQNLILISAPVLPHHNAYTNSEVWLLLLITPPQLRDIQYAVRPLTKLSKLHGVSHFSASEESLSHCHCGRFIDRHNANTAAEELQLNTEATKFDIDL